MTDVVFSVMRRDHASARTREGKKCAVLTCWVLLAGPEQMAVILG